jgi:hypothetical protein
MTAIEPPRSAPRHPIKPLADLRESPLADAFAGP